MHTTVESTRFYHNGDFSGNVDIIDLKTDREVTIPFDDLKELVAAYVRTKAIGTIEDMSADELLRKVPK